MYCYHLFLISSPSVTSVPFLSFIVPVFAWNVCLASLIFLKRSLVFPILLFSSISFDWSLQVAPLKKQDPLPPFRGSVVSIRGCVQPRTGLLRSSALLELGPLPALCALPAKQTQELPTCHRRRASFCQCRRLGFDRWVGKIPWSRKWRPTLLFLPGKFFRQRSLLGYSPQGHKESDMTEWRNTHTHTHEQTLWICWSVNLAFSLFNKSAVLSKSLLILRSIWWPFPPDLRCYRCYFSACTPSNFYCIVFTEGENQQSQESNIRFVS